MTQQAPTSDEIQAAAAFLKKCGRNLDLIPRDKTGPYKIDSHISTGHDVVRHAVMAGMKLRRPAGVPAAPSDKR
jgi:exoribonuclease R